MAGGSLVAVGDADRDSSVFLSFASTSPPVFVHQASCRLLASDESADSLRARQQENERVMSEQLLTQISSFMCANAVLASMACLQKL